MGTYYAPTGLNIARPQGIDLRDFNTSLAGLTGSISDIQNKRLAEAEILRKQGNADRTYEMQKIAADNQNTLFKQKQDEFKRVQAQRAMEEAVYNTENSSSPVAGNVNALYDQFNKKYDGIIPGGTDIDAYTSELDALNQSAIYNHFGGDSQGKTQVSNAQAAPYFDGRDDALATKEALLKQIMAGGNHTAAEADALATKELTRRFPLASAESIKNAQAQEKTIYDAKIKLLAKNSDGSGMTVDPETGAVSFGSGAFKTVSTQHDKPELIASTIKDIATNKDWTGTLSGKLFGETRPTEGNLYKARNVLSEMGYDDTQIATGLRSGIQYNWLTDDALATPATIARYMGKPSASSVRTTNKGGSGSASSANTQAAYQKLTDDYRARNAAIAGSGIHQGATQARYNTERPITPTKSITEIAKEKNEQKAIAKKQKQAEANAAVIEQQRIAAAKKLSQEDAKKVEVESGMPGVTYLSDNIPGIVSSDTEDEVPTQVPKDNRTYSEFRNDLSRPETLKETLIREDDQAKRNWLINHQNQGVIETNDSVMFPIGKVGGKSISNVAKRGEDALTKSYNKKFFDVGMQRTKNAEVRKVRKEFAKQQASKSTKNLDIPSVIRNKLDGLEMAIKRSDDLREIAILRKQHSDLLNSVATIK